MCKSRDPFFYTGVIVRARCARYYTEVLISQYAIKAFKQLMICHKSYVYRVYSCFVNSLSCIGEWACWEKRGFFYEKFKQSFVYMHVHTEKYMQTSTTK